MSGSNIKHINIDCRDFLKTCEDKKFDLLLQDTPFGVTRNDWDVKPDLKEMWPEWIRVSKDNAAIVFFATQPFASELILSNQKMFRYDLIWYKALGTGFLNANKMPLRNHEHILVFYRSLPTYNPQKGIGVRKKRTNKNSRTGTNYGKLATEAGNSYVDDRGTRFPQSVIDFTNGTRGSMQTDHPTQKPVDLIRYLVRTFSNENDLVFDGYFGSGTIAIACRKENRDCICCEIDKNYYEDAVRRYEHYIIQQDLFQKH